MPEFDLEPGPVRSATPFADLGIVGGLRVHLLSVEQWASHGELRVGFCGPAGWLELETGPIRGRWEVTGVNGVTVEGVIGSGGGSEDLSIYDVEVPSFDKLPLPWAIRLHRNGTTSASTIVGELRDMVSLRPNTVGPSLAVEVAEGIRGCRRCTGPMTGSGRVCDDCRATVAAWGRVVDANSWTASPSGQALMFDLGTTAKGELSILSIEAWPGWFILRVHVTEKWEARSGGILGAWTACDDWGNEFRGFPFHMSGDQTGFGQDVAFVGEVDPRATLLCLTVSIRGSIALEADLPIDLGSWSSR